MTGKQGGNYKLKVCPRSMTKFPSQTKILYQTGNISDDNFVALSSGGVSGDLNLPKDLSLLNRRGYASTTRKGVPLIFQCKIDFYLHDENGAVASALPADTQGILKLQGCQNNWVMRNAAVKFHAAREQMYKRQGVRKSDRGAYSHEIRYNYDGNSDSWLVPIDGDGAAFTGGTWDASKLVTESDQSIFLKLVGPGTDEDTGNTATSLQIGHSYLMSRPQVLADTNPGLDETPGDQSILNSLLMPVTISTAAEDEVVNLAKGEQDNPPYELVDVSDSGDVNHDITEPVELGRAVAGFGNAYGSMICEIPFGLAKISARTSQDGDQGNINGLICVEVLDIYEMQG